MSEGRALRRRHTCDDSIVLFHYASGDEYTRKQDVHEIRRHHGLRQTRAFV